jgi:hypothetical protein
MLPRLDLPGRRDLTLPNSLQTKPSAQPCPSGMRRLAPTAAAKGPSLPCCTSSSATPLGWARRRSAALTVRPRP